MAVPNRQTDLTQHRLKVLQAATIEFTVRVFLLPFGEWFRDRGWSVDVLANGVTTSDECKAAYDGVFESTWTRNPLSLSNFGTAPGIVNRVVEEGGYDIVHVHTPIAAFVVRWALRKRRREGKVAVIYTAHGFHFHERGSWLQNALFRGAEKLAGRWTDLMVVLTQTDFDAALEQGVVDRDRLRLIPGIGIDTRRFDPETVPDSAVTALWAELGIGPDEPVVLTVSRIAGGKRHDDMLRAVALLDRPIHTLLAGDGPLVDELRGLSESLGIGDRVHFLGHRTDVPTLIKASSVTVIASEREGLSRLVLESMSMGVPIVGSDVRGVRELVGNDECGTVFQVGDVPALASAIDRLLESPDLAAEKGTRGRILVKEYDIERVLEAYGSVYLQVVGR